MAPPRKTCPECGDELYAMHLPGHLRKVHGIEPEPKRDAPPGEPKRPRGPAALPLTVQLQFPYQLAADATRNRLPATSAMLVRQAAPCAAAWDRFLLRYPSLRKKIEEGAIATDVVALIMAHVPIVTTAREELAAQRAQMESYEGGLAPHQPQHAAA